MCQAEGDTSGDSAGHSGLTWIEAMLQVRLAVCLIVVAAVPSSCSSHRSAVPASSCLLVSVRAPADWQISDSATRIGVRLDCGLPPQVTLTIERAGRPERIAGNPLELRGTAPVLRTAWVNWCGPQRGLTLVARSGKAVARVALRHGPACLDQGERSRLGPDLRARAVALVRKKSYRADLSTWDDFFRFNVLIGTYVHSADGYNRRAFFFVDGRFLRTDAATPSAEVQEVWRDDRTIALLYILHHRNDPLCCPTGGGAIVRFRQEGSRVVPLDRIPPRWPADLWR